MPWLARSVFALTIASAAALIGAPPAGAPAASPAGGTAWAAGFFKTDAGRSPLIELHRSS